MAYDEFSKRAQAPDFARVQARVRKAVENDPALAQRVDENEGEFCRMFDRIAAQTRAERISLHEAARPVFLPTQPEPSAEDARRNKLFEQARSGGLHEAGELLDHISKTRMED